MCKIKKIIGFLDCGLGWTEYNSSCYRCFASETEKYTWHEAKKECSDSRAHLVSIHSVEEHRFIQTIIPTFDSFSQFFPWIGAKFVAENSSRSDENNFSSKSNLNEGTVKTGWKWEDHSDVDYWDEHYSPSGSDLTNNCIAINNWAYGLWVDAECDSRHTYVCKRKLI